MPDAGGLGLQGALKAAIEALMPMTIGGSSRTVPVYDSVPQDQVGLYIQIGDGDVGAPAGTKTFDGVAHAMEINIYSDHRGLRDVKQVIKALYQGLVGQTLTVADVQVAHLRHEFDTAFISPSGAQGTLRLGTITY